MTLEITADDAVKFSTLFLAKDIKILELKQMDNTRWTLSIDGVVISIRCINNDMTTVARLVAMNQMTDDVAEETGD